MANPALIQKQIKDNTEDLHNFVRDLNLWEQEMKRKDRQLSNEQIDEVGFWLLTRRTRLESNIMLLGLIKNNLDAGVRFHNHVR